MFKQQLMTCDRHTVYSDSHQKLPEVSEKHNDYRVENLSLFPTENCRSLESVKPCYRFNQDPYIQGAL